MTSFSILSNFLWKKLWFFFGNSGCKVIKLANGFIPFGSGMHFIPPNEMTEYVEMVMGKDSEKEVSLVSVKSKTEKSLKNPLM